MTLKIPSPPDKEWIEAALRYSNAKTTQELEDSAWPFLRANENPGRAASRILAYAYMIADADVQSLQVALSQCEEQQEERGGQTVVVYLLICIFMWAIMALVWWFFASEGGSQ